MSNRDLAELTWENGHLAMNGFGPTWDTLESVVHQATVSNKEAGLGPAQLSNHPNKDILVNKRIRSESDYKHLHKEEDWAGARICASANAAFCRENDGNMWAVSHGSSRSTRTKTTDEDSACQGGSENYLEGRDSKSETLGRSQSARKGRAAAVHNQSERRRRDRINKKMKALQKLVPNASKTDKASMLDEVIEYLKLLQAQVQLMGASSSMSQQMMTPLGIQQQLQMSILARASMGLGLGMGLPHHQLGAFVAPPFFAGPSSAPQQAKPLVPFHDQYNPFLNQSMNMELYNRMTELYGQHMNQSAKTNHSRTKPVQEG